MKKFIITTLASIVAILGMVGISHAQAVFNNPAPMPTLTIRKSTGYTGGVAGSGNWQTSATADAGDLVAVHVYYENTSNTPAQETTLSIKPASSSATTSLVFSGGVASISGPRATGQATLSITSAQTVTFQSADWYPSASSNARPVNGSALTGTSGFNIGTVNPGQQGVLVAFFRIGNTVVNPTIYQCNDGIDNDGDGRIDYPNDPGCVSYNDDSEFNQVVTNTQPQAITTVATITSNTSARLNGLAVPNFSGSSTAWFEWGTSGSLGSRTSAQTVSSATQSAYSDIVTGLVPGTMYYYRAVVQNQNGIAYGDIVRFQTQTTVVQPPRVITRTVVRERDVVTARSAPSLLELRVENVYDRMCVGGDMEYTVSYRNISGQTLQNAVLRVVHPQELTFINGSRGTYEAVDRALTIPLGDLQAGVSGSVVVRARVNNEAIRGNVAVLTAQVVYTNTVTRAQEDAIAYSLVSISETCPNNLGANAFGLGFLPNTLLGWLILILVILALIVLGRQLYKKKTV